MAFVFGSFAASLGGRNRFRLCHKRSTHWVPAILLAPLAVSTSPVNCFNWWTTCHPPHPPQTSCVASNMCASARNVIIPPSHPPQTSCVASNMCASARNVIFPPPPTPDQLRSIQHVCKCKECYHPPVPPTPDQLRGIQHVCKCKECYHPPVPPTPDQLRSIQHVRKCKECYHPPPPQDATKWGEIWQFAQKPTAFCEPWANYQPQLVNAGFLPSTVCKYFLMMDSTLNLSTAIGSKAVKPVNPVATELAERAVSWLCHVVTGYFFLRL